MVTMHLTLGVLQKYSQVNTVPQFLASPAKVRVVQTKNEQKDVFKIPSRLHPKECFLRYMYILVIEAVPALR